MNTALQQAGYESLEEDFHLDDFINPGLISPSLSDRSFYRDVEYRIGEYGLEEDPVESFLDLGLLNPPLSPHSSLALGNPVDLSMFFDLLRSTETSLPWRSEIALLEEQRPERLHEIVVALLYTSKLRSPEKTVDAYLRFADSIGEICRFLATRICPEECNEEYFIRLWFGGVLRYLDIWYGVKEETTALREAVERLRCEREEAGGLVKRLNEEDLNLLNPYHRVWEWNLRSLKFSIDPTATCPVCLRNSEEFEKAHILTVHVKRAHKPYECSEPGCTRRSGSKTDLARHWKTKHSRARVKDYTCRFCGYSVMRKDNYEKHMRKRPSRCLRGIHRQ